MPRGSPVPRRGFRRPGCGPSWPARPPARGLSLRQPPGGGAPGCLWQIASGSGRALFLWMVAGRVPSGRAAVWCAAWIGLAAVSARGGLGTSVPAGRPAAPLGVAGGVVHHDQPDGEADRHDDGDDYRSEGGSGHVSSSFRERRRWPAPSAEHRLGGLWSARCRWEWWWSCLHGGRPWRPPVGAIDLSGYNPDLYLGGWPDDA